MTLADAIRTTRKAQCQMGEPLAERLDRIEACYWWFADHHGGQWSDGYEALSILGGIFSPGICSNGPEPDSVSEMLYNELCHEAGCDHD